MENKTDLGNKTIMSSNIQLYMKARNKTRQDMCELLGVPYSTFSDWYNGKKYPRIDKIEAMANIFNCYKSDLVEYSSLPVDQRDILHGLADKRARSVDLDIEINKMNDAQLLKLLTYARLINDNTL